MNTSLCVAEDFAGARPELDQRVVGFTAAVEMARGVVLQDVFDVVGFKLPDRILDAVGILCYPLLVILPGVLLESVPAFISRHADHLPNSWGKLAALPGFQRRRKCRC